MRLCPACRETASEPFYEMPAAPVLCNVLCRSEAEARAVPTAPITLSLCRGCGLVFNTAFDPSAVSYGGEYENALHFSSVFRAHEDRLVSRLVDDFGMRGTTVAEIGCGDGHFLSALCQRGSNTGLGFDPAYDAARHAGGLHERVEIRAEHFDATSLEGVEAGCVCCRHVLEHIADPAAFLGNMRRAIGPRTNTLVYFEVPSAMHSLERAGYWDVIYEHCNYFTPTALQSLFARCGFEPIETAETYSGQFLGIFARPARPAEPRPDARQMQRLATLAERFGEGFRSTLASWENRLSGLNGRPAVAWGAGSKGVMFLNALGDAAPIRHIVDLNPRKHACYIVGTGQEIVPPARIPEIDPSLVIVMNAAYLDEIAEALGRMGCVAERAAAS